MIKYLTELIDCAALYELDKVIITEVNNIGLMM